MKKIITLILILFSTTALTQDYKILYINALWNKENSLSLPNKIEGVTVDFAILEDQTKSLQEKIQAVPVVILYKENRVVKLTTIQNAYLFADDTLPQPSSGAFGSIVGTVKNDSTISSYLKFYCRLISSK